MLAQGVLQCSAALAAGKTSSADLVEEALAKIADPGGEGDLAFTEVFAGEARAEAAEADRRRAEGASAGRLAGIPISVKDLFDLVGRVTRAGSVVLKDEPPARRDAAAVARLRAEGAVVIGRTNMTELAFSGLGLNPHYGTPANPWHRDERRIPGGSSSGAAVSVADGMCAAAIGSDTGGSVRIPSALCGLAGFKPTREAVSRDGAYPLSTTLDSVGPIAPTIADCALLFAIMSGTTVAEPLSEDVPLRLVVATNYVTDGMDETVTAAFAAALDRLRAAGITIEPHRIAAFDRLPEMARIGAYPGIEAYAAQRVRLEAHREAFDPRVASRILAAGTLPADTVARLDVARAAYIEELAAEIAPYDGMLMPTVPVVAPRIADLADDAAYGAANLLMLRNPTTINLLGGCAASLPVHEPGTAPVGLSLAGPAGSDMRILAIAERLSRILSH